MTKVKAGFVRLSSIQSRAVLTQVKSSELGSCGSVH